MDDPLNPIKAPKGISEDEIREKVRAGLDRSQAIEVITRQREQDDAIQAAQAAKASGAKSTSKPAGKPASPGSGPADAK